MDKTENEVPFFVPWITEEDRKAVLEVLSSRWLTGGPKAKEFEKLAEKFKEKQSIAYSTSGLFKPDDVIDHKTFGMGIVINASYYKMEVAFSDRNRLLVCNR